MGVILENYAENEQNHKCYILGALGRGSVYNLTVAQDQSSFGTVLVQNGPPDRPNILAAGWTVMDFILHLIRFLLEFSILFLSLLLIQDRQRKLTSC